MVSIAIRSNKGPRENLEDTACAVVLQTANPMAAHVPFFGVFDGVGGQAGGEYASHLAMAVTTGSMTAEMVALPPAQEPPPPQQVSELLVQSLRSANAAVVAAVAQDKTRSGMATTAVCVVIIKSVLHLAWVGDSRCYLLQDGKLHCLTRDHKQVQDLLDAGLIEPSEAGSHPLGHTISRYVGQPECFEPEIWARRLQEGDHLLLCTDGLTDVVTDADIHHQLQTCRRRQGSLDRLAEGLVEQALKRGTGDNVTVLCYRHASQARDLTAPSRTRTDNYAAVAAETLYHLRQENHDAQRRTPAATS